MPSSSSYRIKADHAVFDGHFPGNPVVPAAMILDYVIRHATQLGARVKGLDKVKFIAPLLPEQAFRIELDLQQDDARFSVLCGQDTIARGHLKLSTD